MHMVEYKDFQRKLVVRGEVVKKEIRDNMEKHVSSMPYEPILKMDDPFAPKKVLQ
jgi:hypothetical protein